MGRGKKKVRQPNFKLGNGNYEQNNQTNTNERIKAWTVKGVGFNSEKAPILGTITLETTSKDLASIESCSLGIQ